MRKLQFTSPGHCFQEGWTLASHFPDSHEVALGKGNKEKAVAAFLHDHRLPDEMCSPRHGKEQYMLQFLNFQTHKVRQKSIFLSSASEIISRLWLTLRQVLKLVIRIYACPKNGRLCNCGDLTGKPSWPGYPDGPGVPLDPIGPCKRWQKVCLWKYQELTLLSTKLVPPKCLCHLDSVY